MDVDNRRLVSCMVRAMQGEELTLGFLGGPITQGSLASRPEHSYAENVYRWWKETFPNAHFQYVNAGVGGTDSHFGTARAKRDLLEKDPDVVVVDFSVNDLPEKHFQETFEGLLRKILGWHSRPAVLVLNNVYYDTGKSAQDLHNQVAGHYQVPWVSIRDTVYREMAGGVYAMGELTADGLHPNDFGHGLVAREVIRYLEEVKQEAQKQGVCGIVKNGWIFAEERKLPEPLTRNGYEHAVYLDCRNSFPELSGFVPDAREEMYRGDFFRNGWIGKKKGNGICFEVECSCLAIQYRKAVGGRACIAGITVEREDGSGKSKGETIGNGVMLDGNFDEDWGDCLYLQELLRYRDRARYKVRIEVTKEGEIPFYLLSLIVA